MIQNGYHNMRNTLICDCCYENNYVHIHITNMINMINACKGVCLPGAKIEAITERVENIVGSGKGGSVLVHVGTNNIKREGTSAIVMKYRNLVRTLKQTRVEQVILSWILPVIGRRGHRYRNCRGVAINMLVEKLCREEEVDFVGKFCWKG